MLMSLGLKAMRVPPDKLPSFQRSLIGAHPGLCSRDSPDAQ